MSEEDFSKSFFLVSAHGDGAHSRAVYGFELMVQYVFYAIYGQMYRDVDWDKFVDGEEWSMITQDLHDKDEWEKAGDGSSFFYHVVDFSEDGCVTVQRITEMRVVTDVVAELRVSPAHPHSGYLH